MALPAVPLAQQERHDPCVLFRDHFLSDLIGFVYSGMDAGAGGWTTFCDRIRENCRGILGSGRDALVPIILDGENAWEYYDQNGRPFLRELYRRIADDWRNERDHRQGGLAKDAARAASTTFSRVPGSTPISMSGSAPEEDNQAWEYLLRARANVATASPGCRKNSARMA